MSGGGSDGDHDRTVALIVGKQAAFTRQFMRTRSASFSSTVADRFFTDNSMNRQQRVVETTRRRQARARDRALEQESELQRLQDAYESQQRLQQRQRQREALRMQRKLDHVAASYIQYVWRKQRAQKRWQARRTQAGQQIVRFVESYHHQWRAHCIHACVRIQRHWRDHTQQQLLKRCLRVIGWVLGSRIRLRRQRRTRAVVTIQRWLQMHWRRRRQCAAVHIQWSWRAMRWRQCVSLAARVWREVAASRVLQLAMGRYTARQRVLRSPSFAAYHGRTRSAPRRVDRPAASPAAWKQQQETLQAMAASLQCLQQEEAALMQEIEALRMRVHEASQRKEQESARLARVHAWATQRRARDDEALRAQLAEWEAVTRREIRAELEHEFEIERRARRRGKPLAVGKLSAAPGEEEDGCSYEVHRGGGGGRWSASHNLADERIE